MPSRVREIDLVTIQSTGELLSGVDYVLVGKGRRVEQIVAVTVPSTAVGYIGLRIGADGDPIRLNTQGQILNLAGDDAVNGIWLVWMGTPSINPTGTVEFALGAG